MSDILYQKVWTHFALSDPRIHIHEDMSNEFNYNSIQSRFMFNVYKMHLTHLDFSVGFRLILIYIFTINNFLIYEKLFPCYKDCMIKRPESSEK